jgi:two-component system NtrC family response regulator
MPNILIVDDNHKLALMLEKTLTRLGHNAYTASTLEKGLELADTLQVDLIFLDLFLPDGSGLDALERFSAVVSSPEIIIITGHGNESGAKYALEFGVFDFLQKPLDLDEIRLTATRALEFRTFRRQQNPPKIFQRGDIIGKNHQFQQCLQETAMAAGNDNPVLITGETGTGKDLIAHAVHQNSSRAEAGFIIVDCAALQGSLIEGTLFGHVKGAFTGANTSQEGRAALAHKGTMFLDEIGELDLEAQKRFLRLLENKSYYPLGSKKEFQSDFRLVAATNQNIDKMVEKGRFRADLYFRIRSQMIHLPPLRQRTDDIRELIFYFLDKICKQEQISPPSVYPEFVETLLKYDWPGNIRELVNVLTDTLSRFPGVARLQPRHLPVYLRLAHRPLSEEPSGQHSDLEEAIREVLPLHNELPDWKKLRKQAFDVLEEVYFQELSRRTGGRVSEMARLSGLTKVRIYELLKKHTFKST